MDFSKAWLCLNAFVHVSLRLESRSQKALEKQYLFRDSVRFKLIFFFVSSLGQKTVLHSYYMIWLIFYVERVTAHRIKRNDHSCFHNRLPNSKTQLKLNHLWEQGGLVFRGALRSLRILRIGRIGSMASSILLNKVSPTEMQRILVKRIAQNLCKHSF